MNLPMALVAFHDSSIENSRHAAKMLRIIFCPYWPLESCQLDVFYWMIDPSSAFL
jgi:hypothetical protein